MRTDQKTLLVSIVSGAAFMGVSAWADPLPDLRPTDAHFGAPAVSAQSVDVSWTVTNEGPDAIPGIAHWYDFLYLSTDTVWDAGDTQLMYKDVTGPLAHAATYMGTATVTLPYVAPGTYYLILRTDEYNHIDESDEDDNVSAFAVTIRAPDLFPVNMLASGSAIAAQSAEVAWQVTNQGDGAIPDTLYWYDVLYLSTDAVLDAGDTYLAQAVINGPLASAGVYTNIVTVTLPRVAPGTYYLVLTTDPYGFIHESDEANNVQAFPITIQAPDLSPTDAQTVGPAVAGQSVGFTWTVANDGDGAIPDTAWWYDYLFLSSDAVLDEADTLLTGSNEAGPLSANTTYTRTEAVSVPRLPPGVYYLILSTDYLRDNVFESDELNNTAAFPFEITAPDLQPTAVQVVGPAVAGQLATVAWTVVNQGNGTIAGTAYWYDYLFLSADAVLDGADTQLTGLGELGPLGVGVSYTRTQSVTLPSVAPGAYYLILTTDDVYDLVFESDEANNAGVFPLRSTVALQIRIVGETATVEWPTTVDEWSLMRSSDLPAGLWHPNTDPVETTGGMHRLSTTVGSLPAFFRLDSQTWAPPIL